MAIRKFIVGLVFVSFFSIGAGTVYAGWNLVSTCTRAVDGVVFKIKSNGNVYRIRKCVGSNCSWLNTAYSSISEALEMVRVKYNCVGY